MMSMEKRELFHVPVRRVGGRKYYLEAEIKDCILREM